MPVYQNFGNIPGGFPVLDNNKDVILDADDQAIYWKSSGVTWKMISHNSGEFPYLRLLDFTNSINLLEFMRDNVLSEYTCKFRADKYLIGSYTNNDIIFYWRLNTQPFLRFARNSPTDYDMYVMEDGAWVLK